MIFEKAIRIALRSAGVRKIAVGLATMTSVLSPCSAPAQQASSSVSLSDQFGVVSITAKVADSYVPGFGVVKGLYLYDVRGPGLSLGMPLGLMPPVLSAPQRRTLTIDFVNQLPEQSNLHTHGLAIKPTGLGFGEKGVRPLYGECILVNALPDGANPPAGQLAGKDPCAATSGPVASVLEAQPIRYRDVIPPSHWPGLYWFHPHVHGEAEKQLVSGLSGLMTIGDIWDYAYFECWLGTGAPPTGAKRCRTLEEEHREKAFRQAADVRFLALKDIQVDRDGEGWKRHQEGNEFYDKSRCGDDISFDVTLPSELRRLAPLFTTPNTHIEPGVCWSGDGSKRWLFTVSGERYPTLTAPPGSVQVWRLANMSADATYRLRVETKDEEAPHCPGSTAALPREKQRHCLNMVLLSRDGVPVPGAEGGVTEREITLMPSARAEVYVPRCTGRGGAASRRDGCLDRDRDTLAELVTVGVSTGVDVGGADVWPPIALARVVGEAGEGRMSRLAPADLAPAPRSAGGGALKAAGEKTSKAAPTAPEPAPLLGPGQAGGCDPNKVYDRGPAVFPREGNLLRLLRFNNTTFNNDTIEKFGIHVENFRLHDAQSGRKIRVAELLDRNNGGKLLGRVNLRDDCQSAAGDNLDIFSKYYPEFPSSHAAHGNVPVTSAWRSDAPEYWLLINDSDECHNFHIHQTKFEVAASDVVRDPAGPSRDQCLGDRDPRKLSSGALHDNFPLPPGARILVRLTFGPEQLGRFVFHCHILEHEDKGMMSAIEVNERP